MIGITALARALLQPKRPRWRVFELDDASARTVSFAVQAIAVVYALDYLARRVVSILSLPLSTSIVTAFIASILYAGNAAPHRAHAADDVQRRAGRTRLALAAATGSRSSSLRSPLCWSAPRCSATSRSAASSSRKS